MVSENIWFIHFYEISLHASFVKLQSKVRPMQIMEKLIHQILYEHYIFDSIVIHFIHTKQL